jgi:alkanesulfonate monooxygenase SsuD/methylene tetrahydromethanopterin reductase-like flavin-dependent oxidoreductase (luciferase family)
MRIAVFMGPFARDPSDDRALIEYCLKAAERAANDGFALITFGEQHFNNYEPYCNPFLMGARLAPVLGDAWFATTVVPLPYHNPIRLAEDMNVLDQLMGGKLIVGMSAGRVGFSPDFENFGLDPKDQRAIFTEKMAALKTLWAHRQEDGPLQFDGAWVKGGVHGRVMPMSYRAPHPHVAIGSSTSATLRRAGVDGNIVFLGPCPLTEADEKFTLYREGLAEGGHSIAHAADALGKSMVHHQFIVADSDDIAWGMAERMMGFHPLIDRREDKRTLRQMNDDYLNGTMGTTPRAVQNAIAVAGWIVAGNPQAVIDQIEAHRAVGIKMVHTRFAFGPYNPTAWDANYRKFVEQVMPHVQPERIPALQEAELQPMVQAGPKPQSARSYS